MSNQRQLITIHKSQITVYHHNSLLITHYPSPQMLEALITSKTRIRLLLKFFLNTTSTGYLRGLSEEFNESTNGLRVELNRLEEAGLLEAQSDGYLKVFQANNVWDLEGEAVAGG